jgi:hypothetical protein
MAVRPAAADPEVRKLLADKGLLSATRDAPAQQRIARTG